MVQGLPLAEEILVEPLCHPAVITHRMFIHTGCSRVLHILTHVHSTPLLRSRLEKSILKNLVLIQVPRDLPFLGVKSQFGHPAVITRRYSARAYKSGYRKTQSSVQFHVTSPFEASKISWLRCSRTSLSRPRDWYKCNNSSFQIRTFLALSCSTGLPSETTTPPKPNKLALRARESHYHSKR